MYILYFPQKQLQKEKTFDKLYAIYSIGKVVIKEVIMSKIDSKLKLDSLLIHGGQEPDPVTGSIAMPLYQTTAYEYKSTEYAAGIFDFTQSGNIYTRLMNPTTDVLEKRMTLLEGGIAALATASGQSAVLLSILNIAKSGDEIVACDNLYGGTYNLFNHTFVKMGIKVNFVESNNLDAIRKAITPKTKAIYSETMGNPKFDIADISAISKIAHENDIPYIIDNTCTPYLLRPIEFGADIVIHSATKYIGGHGTSMGGLLIDSGNFNWDNGKFPLITEPEPSYHGLDCWKKFNKMTYIFKARACLMRDMGPAISPFNSFLILQGLETLHLRMKRHSETAMIVAEFLEKHPKVEWVNYCGLESSPEHTRALKYLKGGFGGVFGFGIKGGLKAGQKFIDSLELILHTANLGDVRTLATHPASTTHQQLTPEEQLTAGVNPELIRLSIGLEDPEDIINDIENAISKIK